MKKFFFYALCLCVGAMSLAGCEDDESDDLVCSNNAQTVISKGDSCVDGHDYVDLGLSVKWATYNVGATQPEEYGDYFAWGETTTKADYSWMTYKYCNGSKATLTKYNVDSGYGIVDNKISLELSDDAARANWGGNWRMPTVEEWEDLCHNSMWSWTCLGDSVWGYVVTSDKNGKNIFLPAAGGRGGKELLGAGYYGYYWSSTLFDCEPDGSLFLYFGPYDLYTFDANFRYFGRSVRPVIP